MPASEEKYRTYAKISFVTVLIVVGLPLWWKTTEVYRVSLPYRRIAELENQPLIIAADIRILSDDAPRAKLVERALRDAFPADRFDLRFRHAPRPPDVVSPGGFVSGEGGAGSLQLVEWPDSPHPVHITSSRTVLFRPSVDVSLLCRVVRDRIFDVDSLESAANAAPDPAARRRMPPSLSFDVDLSVAVSDPDDPRLSWDPREALDEYFLPFASRLSGVHNLTFKSRWLHFVHAGSDAPPRLITPLEKRLASHASESPCVNFVLYVPSCRRSAERVRVRDGTPEAFLSPRWGGVVVGDPPERACARRTDGDGPAPTYRPPTERIMGLFLSQLRWLIGMRSQDDGGPEAFAERSRDGSPARWEVDSLTRLRTVERARSAGSTLRSLARLLGEISNIVIDDRVGASVRAAAADVERTARHLRDGDLSSALRTSGEAYLSAEAAFTDPSLLALLYFPDDQKYAVYIPLFLPVMIPVVMSFRGLRGRPGGDQ